MRTVKHNEIADPLPELKMLPIYYLFPQELLDATEFPDFPRNPYKVIDNPEWMAKYNSDKFLENIIDGTAAMVWKHFGIKASMESFSGYYPFWIMARLGEWVRTAERFGFNTYSMSSKTFEYPILPFKTAQNIFAKFVEDVRKQVPLDDWLAVVKEHPCHEDYEPRFSNSRIDFYRKWYHSRSLTQMEFIGFEDDWERRDDAAHNPWRSVDFQLDLDIFKETLTETERNIWNMLYEGYTQAEIAQTLGLATQSAVSKKAKKIGKKYREYMKEPNF